MQPIIKRDRVELRAGAPRPAAAPRESQAPAAPDPVRPVVVDGVVRALEVRCSCGQVQVVELEYAGEEAVR